MQSCQVKDSRQRDNYFRHHPSPSFQPMNDPTIPYPPLIPALAVHDGAAAIAFYATAFGATELYRLIDPESGKVGHAKLLLNGTMITLADDYPGFSQTPQTLGGTTVRLTLMMDD